MSNSYYEIISARIEKFGGCGEDIRMGWRLMKKYKYKRVFNKAGIE
jgi:hypothetical protein